LSNVLCRRPSISNRASLSTRRFRFGLAIVISPKSGSSLDCGSRMYAPSASQSVHGKLRHPLAKVYKARVTNLRRNGGWHRLIRCWGFKKHCIVSVCGG
jgi:hypothetical protein